jgi:molecular chaperone HtpG
MAFYKDKFFDMDDPVSVIRISAEGTVTYKAMLFIPAKRPTTITPGNIRPGCSCTPSGVMIMEYCSDLLPEHFRFVRGIVDSQDLSLNISVSCCSTTGS